MTAIESRISLYPWLHLYVVRDALGHASVATTQVYLSRVGAHEAIDTMRNREWSPA